MYITQVGLASEMGRYGSLTGELSVSAPKFEHAVRSLAGGTVHGDEAFGLRSLVVFCVAEALRFDSLAYDVGNDGSPRYTEVVTWRPCGGPTYKQPGNLNDAIQVLQLKVPLLFRYSVVYQNVQSSLGSILIAL